MFFNSIKQAKANQQGIALVLTILILANLVLITFVVTDVVLRIGKSSRQISDSEIAYFAAESAIEDAIYQIEHNQDAASLGTLDSPAQNYLTYANGTSESYIEPITTTPVTCIDDTHTTIFPPNPNAHTDKSCVYAANLSAQDDLTQANPLTIRLKPGKSFIIDFNISTPSTLGFYPSALTVDWPGTPTGRVIILTADEQTITDTSTQSRINRIPSSGQLGDSPSYRLSIMNTSSGDITYTVSPQASGSLPIGIAVTAKGYYDVDKKERIIEVERKSWEIY